MKIGVIFPQIEIGCDPSILRDFAETAEAVGFSHISAFDHILGAEHSERDPELTGPYLETDDFHEPLTLFSFFAGVTRAIEFVTGVLVLPQRQAPLVAKQAAELAILSQGRFRLGIGVGWNYVEYEGMGEEFRSRGRRLDEQVSVMRQLWSGQVLSYEGEWHHFERIAMSPIPPNPVPIWFGGFSPAAQRRAARIGDGFLFARVGDSVSGGRPTHDVSTIIDQSQEMKQMVERFGRDPQKFGLEGRINFRDGSETWRRERDLFEKAGFDYIAINTMRGGIRSPQGHVDVLKEIADQLELHPRDDKVVYK